MSFYVLLASCCALAACFWVTWPLLNIEIEISVMMCLVSQLSAQLAILCHLV